MKRARTEHGFTLIELVVVIAVIGVLAAVVIPAILMQGERARASRARAEVRSIAAAAARVRSDTASANEACYSTLANLGLSAAPAACGSGLPACNGAGGIAGQTCWSGPYLDPVPAGDPWATAYTVTFGTDNRVTVRSNGPDRVANNADDLTAIQ